VLTTTVAHYRQFGDILAEFNDRASVVVLGAQDALEQAEVGLQWTRVL